MASTLMNAAEESTPTFYDSHNHYQRVLRARPDAPRLPHVKHCPMAVDESDWAEMPGLLERDDIVMAGAGIHPWFAHQPKSSDWAARLGALLEAQPRLIVGEIGLDKVARTPDTRQVEWEEQVRVFQAQMALAASLRRPVSMHCVKAHGFLFDYLRTRPAEDLPPAVAMHSFTGSVDMAKAFLRLTGTEVYLGFSSPINLKTEGMAHKMAEVLSHVPLDRVLLESDLEEDADMSQALLDACRAITAAKAHEVAGLTLGQVATITAENVRRFMATIGRPPPAPKPKKKKVPSSEA